jgi:hypothetical protein
MNNQTMERNVKMLVIQFNIDSLSDVGAIEVKMNLESWVPTKEEIEYVIHDMEGLANSQSEDCGEYDLAKETYELIDRIKNSQNIDEQRELMQDHLVDMFYAVPTGLMRNYYSTEYADFIEKALGVQYVVMGESFTKL